MEPLHLKSKPPQRRVATKMIQKAMQDGPEGWSRKNTSGRDEDDPASASANNGQDDAMAAKGRNEDDPEVDASPENGHNTPITGTQLAFLSILDLRFLAAVSGIYPWKLIRWLGRNK